MKLFIRYFQLYYSLIGMNLMRDIEYRFNFVFRSCIELAYLIINIIFFNVIYSYVDDIAGWQKNEVLLLMVSSNLLDSVITLLFNDGLSELPVLINQGTLDFILLKPVNKRFYISFNKINFPQIVSIIISSLFFGYFFNKLATNAIAMIPFVIFFANSIFLLYCIFFLIMTISFWTIKVDVGTQLFYHLWYIGNRPMDIFPEMITKIFTFVIPLFIVFNYPVISISKGLGLLEGGAAFVFSIGLFFVTNYLFKKGLQAYASASS